MAIAYNRVVLAGNLTRDIEIRFSPSGLPIARLGLAINSKKKQGDTYVDDTCFIDCTAFGKTAELAGDYLQKGRPVLIEGRLSFQTWDDKTTGAKRSKHEVLIDRIVFLSSRAEVASDTISQPESNNTDEVPF